MATFNEIKEVRLTIGDPQGVINILEVADFASIPATPARQTAYKTVDTGYYYVDGEAVDLRMSDERISGWIDDGGSDYAICQSIQQILNQIGRELIITKDTSGAESTDFINLTTLRTYYEKLKATYSLESKEIKTGIWGQAKQPTIAGGEV